MSVSTVVAVGPTAQTIAEEAEHRHADLIVMATHGYTGIERWQLGSIADQVLHATTTPLLLVRSQRHATTLTQTDSANAAVHSGRSPGAIP